MKAGSPGVVSSPVPVSAFIREYLDNGLAVYDADRRRFGTVADFDQSGSCFVVRTTTPDTSLCIPLGLVTKVRRGRVYVSKSVTDLSGRLLHSYRPERSWLFRTLCRWFRVTKARA
ncbi:MAG: hypothetical protein QOH92_3668 [Chloroflexota bacterium]|jgi:hypothetical protein|nr:hypothetical protein [Chloroflexota bacterium]